jgi:hypothetical protein
MGGLSVNNLGIIIVEMVNYFYIDRFVIDEIMRGEKSHHVDVYRLSKPRLCINMQKRRKATHKSSLK